MSRIDELVPGERVTGAVSFPPELELFQDHFPRFPVVPGVILLESMAQLAGKCIGYSIRLRRGDWPFPVLSMMNGVKFRKFVRPGEIVDLESRVDQLREEAAVMRSRAWVDGKVVAQAEQVFVYNAVPLEDPVDRAFVEQSERAELARLWPAFDLARWDAGQPKDPG